jgi:hypothetical protein
MAHPNGGQGNRFNPKHSFAEAYAFVGIAGAYSCTARPVKRRSDTDNRFQR